MGDLLKGGQRRGREGGRDWSPGMRTEKEMEVGNKEPWQMCTGGALSGCS